MAKRWAWALEDPWVGLALDPEWRMGPRQVPGRVIGSVGAAEVNKVSAWLSDLVEREGLPEKPFVLHQFRSTMIRDVERVKRRDGLATVQHADGFGNRRQKLATYHTLARPAAVRDGLQAVLRRGREPASAPVRCARSGPRCASCPTSDPQRSD